MFGLFLLFLIPAVLSDWVKVPMSYHDPLAERLSTVGPKDVTILPASEIRVLSTKFNVVNKNKTSHRFEFPKSEGSTLKDKPKSKPNRKSKPKKSAIKKQPSFGLQSVFNFIKSIRSNLALKAGTGILGKIQFLESFRDKILSEIENSIRVLWSSPTKRRTTRPKRGLRGHDNAMDFPEFPLITICFLTFAVFLIKLVLQVIHTIKSKHYTINGMEPTQIGTVRIIKKNSNPRMIQDNDSFDMYNYVNVMKSIYN